MQSLDVISLNIWQIVISLCNLIILYLILRKFLYAPVRKVLAARTDAVSKQYAEADQAKEAAEADRAAWESKLSGAKDEADALIAEASARADRREQTMIAQAREKADEIVRKAQSDAALELKKAEAQIKDEIVGVSTVIAEKMLSREINAEDHRELIDSFIDQIGETDDADD